MKAFLRHIAKLGNMLRYVGVGLYFYVIIIGKFNTAGIVGLITFFWSYLFREDESYETKSGRRSMFEKLFDL